MTLSVHPDALVDSTWTTQYRNGEVHFHLHVPSSGANLHLTMSAKTAHEMAIALHKAVLDGATEERAIRMLGK